MANPGLHASLSPHPSCLERLGKCDTLKNDLIQGVSGNSPKERLLVRQNQEMFTTQNYRISELKGTSGVISLIPSYR